MQRIPLVTEKDAINSTLAMPLAEENVCYVHFPCFRLSYIANRSNMCSSLLPRHWPTNAKVGWWCTVVIGEIMFQKAQSHSSTVVLAPNSSSDVNFTFILPRIAGTHSVD